MLFLKVTSRNGRMVIQRSWSSCSTLGIWFNTFSASSDHHLVRSYFRHLNPCLGWIMKNLRKHRMCLFNDRIALPWVSSGLLSQDFNLFVKWIVIRNINHQELIRLVEFRSQSGGLLEIYHLSSFGRFRYLYSSWFLFCALSCLQTGDTIIMITSESLLCLWNLPIELTDPRLVFFTIFEKQLLIDLSIFLLFHL